MYLILYYSVVGLVFALLFLNLVFRLSLLKTYRRLVNNKVEFESKHIFSKKLLEEEIIPKYPEMENDIRRFVRHIHNSIYIAAGIVILITILGAVISNYR